MHCIDITANFYSRSEISCDDALNFQKGGGGRWNKSRGGGFFQKLISGPIGGGGLLFDTRGVCKFLV